MYGAFSTYGDVLAETDGTSGALHVRYVLADGQLLSQQQGSSFSHYLTDAQGLAWRLPPADQWHRRHHGYLRLRRIRRGTRADGHHA